MKKGTIWIALTCLMVTSLVLASCTTKTTSSTLTSTTTTTKTTTTTTKTTATTTTTLTTVPASTTAAGNWWNNNPKPQYGGELVIRNNRDIVSFDPYNGETATTVESAWLERLFTDDWTLDPKIWNYKIDFRPDEYTKGSLAQSWEFKDPATLVVKLRHGIHWQNIAPVNGREFVASDVIYHYNRLLGLGDGFTKISPLFSPSTWVNLKSMSAPDNYTVVFNWAISNPEVILETMQAQSGSAVDVEAREAVTQWGNLNDWHHAIGTGPFILTDFVSASSVTLSKNPDYWGYDERYPQNKLPYIEKLKILIISDNATAQAGLRTGKIDILDNLAYSESQSLQKTNPELLLVTNYLPDANTVDPKNDVVPFKDIRVRKAMQMAINLPEIATNYYQGQSDPWPSTLTSNYMVGFGLPYNEWPQDLKDEYAYNPTTAKKLLSDAGYSTGFKTNIVVSNDSDLALLQIVKAYFAAVNIDMEIRTMDPAAWTSFVRTRRAQDQMSTRAAGALGHTFQPSRMINRFQMSYIADEINVNDPVFDAFYPKAMAATTVEEMNQVLKDCDEYVARQHYVISLLQPKLFNLYQPWVNGYAAQSKAISGGSAGAQLLFFYPARFWIDNNLKKSFGH